MSPDAIESDHPDDWRPKANDAFKAVAEAVQECSLFYALYWLDEVQGDDRVAFDFHQQRDLLWRAFQWYGLYTVIRELRHLSEQYLVDGTPAEFSMEDEPGYFQEHLEEAYSDDLQEDYLHIIFQNSQAFRGLKGGNHERETVLEILQTGENAYDAISQPEKFLTHAAAIFEQENPRDPPSSFPVAVGGWDLGYGGPSWKGVVDHLLRADDFPKTAWVNQSWGIQHNNNVWLDKIEVPAETRRAVEGTFKDLNPEVSWSVTTAFYINTVLDQLLDRRKQGDMAFVFRYALQFQDRIGVNLRRVALEHGITREDLDAAGVPASAHMSRENAWVALRAADSMSVLSQTALPEELPEREDRDEVLLTDDELNSISIWMGKLRDAIDLMDREDVDGAEVDVNADRARDIAFTYDKYLRILRDPNLEDLAADLEFQADNTARSRLEATVGSLQKFI